MNKPTSDASQMAQEALSNTNVVIVSGAQWGDEGKGKAVSAFQGENIDYIIGANGGGNAGHTVVYRGNKLDFHELPGGSVIEGATIYLSKGKVIQISTLAGELQKLKQTGAPLNNKLVIAGGAQVIFKSSQQALDKHIEGLKGRDAVGTTMKGIGPAYALGDLRVGITIRELVTMSDEQLSARLKIMAGIFSILNHDEMEREAHKERGILQELMKGGILRIDYNDIMINDAWHKGENLLVEQSQSFLLGKGGGAYPNCTSSDTSISGMLSYLNLPHTVRPHVIATVKAIMSKVGGGLLATKMGREELYAEFEKNFANMTGEKGVTTGRLRDLGWFDVVALRYILCTNPFDTLVITKGDVLAILAQEQEKEGLKKEMRFYDLFRAADGKTTQQGLVTDPSWQGEYSTISLDPQDTQKNITSFGEKLGELIPEFQGPVYFGTGPGDADLMRFSR